MSNLKQIYAAFALYANDWDDQIPYVGSIGSSWFQQLGRAGYCGSPDKTFGATRDRYQVFRCPGEKPALHPNVKKTYWNYSDVGTSYILNWSVSAYAPGDGNYPYRAGFSKGPQWISGGPYTDGNTPSCPTPSDAPFVTDIDDIGDANMQPYFYDQMNYADKWDYVGGWTGWYHGFRHPGERANMLYMDGHVESIAPVWRGGKRGWRMLWNYPPP